MSAVRLRAHANKSETFLAADHHIADRAPSTFPNMKTAFRFGFCGCKKFCHYPQQDCTPLYRRLMDAIRRTGMAMELNTAGLRKDCREIYPARPLVQLAAEYGVPITFGSDAHAVGEVGGRICQGHDQGGRR